MTTKRLDEMLSVLRRCPAPQPADNFEACAIGLVALGWKCVIDGIDDITFVKGGLALRLDRRYGAMSIRRPDGQYRPLPSKARRNIILAGQKEAAK